MPDSAVDATTIVVVPRERFSTAPRSLRSLVAHTAPPYRLIYVDAGSPGDVRDEIAGLAARHGFGVIRSDRPLAPNQARNAGLAEAGGEFVVFADNDLLFTPGWLPPLLACARETGAGLVTPLILAGAARDGLIHFGGGDLVVDRSVDPAIASESHRFTGRRLAEVAAQLQRAPCDYGEFRCLLARRELLQRIGPLDENLLSVLENVDLGLAARAAGAAVYVEPRSRVVPYDAGPFTLADAAYAGLRWSDDWNRRSLDHFAGKWNIDRNSALFAAQSAVLARQQQRAGLPLRTVALPSGPPAPAQTASQLFAELGRLGHAATDIAAVQSAYDLAALLFGGLLRPGGKTFIAHVVGTGSLLAQHGAPVRAIVAGLLHSAYSHGRFPIVAGTTLAAQRAWLRKRIGTDAEGLVDAYHCTAFDPGDGEASHAGLDALPFDLALVVMIRVANEIEGHLDGPWDGTGRGMLPLAPLLPLFEGALGRLGAAAMVERLRRVAQPGTVAAGGRWPVPPMPASYVHSPRTGEKTLAAIRLPPRRRPLRAPDAFAAIPRDASLIGIALAKNECDIIEAFVRYNLRILDGLAVIDHASSDNTRAILRRLQDEGLPLAILEENDPPFRQAERTNALLDRIREARAPEFVVPLDADEFLRVADRDRFVAAIEDCPAGLAPMVPWMTYLPMASDDGAEIDPLRRIRHRRVAEPIPYWKAVLHQPTIADERYRLGEGSHRIFDPAGHEVPWAAVAGVALAHFPARSAEQIRAKLGIGRMAQRLSPDREAGQGVWWMTMRDRLATVDLRRAEGLQAFAALYSAPSAAETMLDPLPDIPYERLAHADLVDVDGIARVTDFFDAILEPAIAAVATADRLRSELDRARSMVAAAEAEAAALRRSTSWRLTAPLRRAATLLRAARGRTGG